MQKGLLKHHNKSILHKSTIYINHVSNILRNTGHLVIHIKDIEGYDNLNDDDLTIIDEIVVESNDMIFTKSNSNAFWNTDLETTLKNLNVDFLIISGFAAEHCVLFTYNGAIERGFNTSILQNGVISEDNNPYNILKDRNLISYNSIEYIIK
jgi:nicotinamidase-related amidase